MGQFRNTQEGEVVNLPIPNQQGCIHPIRWTEWGPMLHGCRWRLYLVRWSRSQACGTRISGVFIRDRELIRYWFFIRIQESKGVHGWKSKLPSRYCRSLGILFTLKRWVKITFLPPILFALKKEDLKVAEKTQTVPSQKKQVSESSIHLLYHFLRVGNFV